MQRVAAIDWRLARRDLQAKGYFHAPSLLAPRECGDLVAWWDHPDRFEREIEMGPRGYGIGSYRYFREPLPAPVRTLRRLLYSRLRGAAGTHRHSPGTEPYPPTLSAFWEQCRAAGQGRASSILLRYPTGGINHPHRDIYGPEWFPFQALVVLSRAGQEFQGGHFLLREELPGCKERERRVTVDQGDLVVFASRERWAIQGRTRRKVAMRHAMSLVRRGERFALGLVFHLAE